MAAAKIIVTKEELENAVRLDEFAPVFKINATTVVKTSSHTRMAEAEVMKYVRANTSIPIPEVHNAYHDETTGDVVIVMDYVEGENLDKAWLRYTEDEKSSVISQLRDYMVQLRQSKGNFIGSIDGTACNDQFFFHDPQGYGPFQTEEEFNKGVVQAMKHDQPSTFVSVRCDVWLNNLKGHSTILSHNDLDPRNILVQGSKIVAIIDWEFAGYYPEYWEYCKALCSPGWEHPWTRDRVVDQILEPYLLELPVFWSAREIFYY